jgi:hypothetical protein
MKVIGSKMRARATFVMEKEGVRECSVTLFYYLITVGLSAWTGKQVTARFTGYILFSFFWLFFRLMITRVFKVMCASRVCPSSKRSHSNKVVSSYMKRWKN